MSTTYHAVAAGRRRRSRASLVVLAVAVAGTAMAGCGDPSGPGTADPSITTAGLSGGVVGQAYSQALNATGGGGDYTWRVVDGSLPPGLDIDQGQAGGTGAAIAGTPTADGSFAFSLEVSVPDGRADTAAFSIEIAPDPDTPLEIVTGSLPAAVVGEAYEEGVDARGAGGNYEWRVVGGELPPGLAISVEDLADNDLLVTGTPETEGEYTFRLEASVPDGRADTAAYTLAVLGRLAIGNVRLAPALAGAAYAARLDAVINAGSLSGDTVWSLVSGSLPSGLALSDDGLIDGFPDTPDTTQFTVRLSIAGESVDRSYTAAVIANDPTRYNITAVPVVEVPAALQDNLAEAIRRWEAAITGDIGAVRYEEGAIAPDRCYGYGQIADGTGIDDIIILVDIDSIDGIGNILAGASPCYVRPGDGEDAWLPTIGALVLDEADLASYADRSEEYATDIIQHEMGHVLGLGALWQECDSTSVNQTCRFDLLEGDGGDDPRYIGAEAVAAYQALGGDSSFINVEEDGGQGTAYVHWEEGNDAGREGYDAELMTGFAEAIGVDMFLSSMTIGALADFGYEVDLSAGENPPLFPVIAPDGAVANGRPWRDILLGEPIRAIAPDGRILHELYFRSHR